MRDRYEPLTFRAWDHVNGIMVYSPDESNFEYTVGIDDNGSLFWATTDSAGDWHELHIMQATGLQDYKGKNVYDGDIIVSESYPFYNEGNHNYVAEVGWEFGSWYYGMCRISHRVRGASCGSQLYELWDANGIVVLGNIYETPELKEIKE